jgi:hypothetical protein
VPAEVDESIVLQSQTVLCDHLRDRIYAVYLTGVLDHEKQCLSVCLDESDSRYESVRSVLR